MYRKSDGFTLVEIIVVLAVLVVLAALLFPAFGRVREKGRQVACASNLKQISLAVQQYVQDSDSHAPPPDWQAAVTPYLKSPAVLTCPSLSEPITTAQGLETGQYNFYIGFLSTMVTQPTTTGPHAILRGVNEAVLVDASKIFVSGDNGVDGFARDVPMPRADACGLTLGNGKPDFVQHPSTIHNGGANYLFYDGHVQWLSPEQFAQSLCDAAPYLQPPFRADGPHLP